MNAQTHDVFDIAGQEKARQEAEDRIKRLRKRDDEDIRWMMGTKQGRRVMYRLLERAGIYRSSFTTNGLQMAFNEGQRNLGLAYTDELSRLAPESYGLMLKEHKDDE